MKEKAFDPVLKEDFDTPPVEVPQSKPCTCLMCGAEEVEAMTPRTTYACGSSDYDQRPQTFRQHVNCKMK